MKKLVYLFVGVMVCGACGGGNVGLDVDAGQGGDADPDADLCVDNDMDMVTDCAGDCDDSDPTV